MSSEIMPDGDRYVVAVDHDRRTVTLSNAPPTSEQLQALRVSPEWYERFKKAMKPRVPKDCKHLRRYRRIGEILRRKGKL